MGKMIVGIYMQDGKRGNQYRWFIPKSLDGQVEKDDLVLVRAGKEKDGRTCAVQVIDILQNDKYQYEPVIKILRKNTEFLKKKEASNKRGKFSDEEKEMIKACRADGKTLKVIAEMYSCSTSTIHRIIKE